MGGPEDTGCLTTLGRVEGNPRIFGVLGLPTLVVEAGEPGPGDIAGAGEGETLAGDRPRLDDSTGGGAGVGGVGEIFRRSLLRLRLGDRLAGLLDDLHGAVEGQRPGQDDSQPSE